MSPKEKAKELVYKYLPFVAGCPPIYDLKSIGSIHLGNAKKCALICVDEILRATEKCGHDCEGEGDSFWQEVIKEIEKI